MNEDKKKSRHYAKSYTPNRTDSVLGKRLKILMNKHEINQNQLAEKLNVTKSTISGWMKADSIQSSYIVALSKLFDVTSDYLLGLSNTSLKNNDVKSVCDLTGLSDAAVVEIIATHNVYPEYIDSLNYLISDSRFFRLWDLYMRIKDDKPTIDGEIFSQSDVTLVIIQRFLVQKHDQYQSENKTVIFDDYFDEFEQKVKTLQKEENDD